MSRINKKHNRNLQRQRRNKGPEMLSQAADNKLKENARDIVTVLFDAAMREDANAANMLVGLAESAEYAESAAVARQACSILERWAHEPQVVMLDTDPRLGAGPQQRLLTNGAASRTDEIPDAEVD